VAAFLEREHRDFFAHWDKVAAASGDRPRQELSAHLNWLAAYITGPRYRGCPFLNMAIEFPESGLPGAHRRPQKQIRAASEIPGAAKGNQSQIAREPGRSTCTVDTMARLQTARVLGKKGPARALAEGGEALIAVATGTFAKRG